MLCRDEIFSVSEEKQNQAGYSRCNNESKEKKLDLYENYPAWSLYLDHDQGGDEHTVSKREDIDMYLEVWKLGAQ